MSLALIVAGLAGIGYWLYRESAQREAQALVAADQQRKAEQAAVAQKESRLAAELKAAQDALAAAEASKRKAEQEAAAQKEAKLAGELRAAKEALAKAATPHPGPLPASGEKESKPGADRYDGVYVGRMCKTMRDGSSRCIPVSVTAQHGALSAAWTNRVTGTKAQAAGTIAPDGAASLSVDAIDAAGGPIKGTMTGRWSSNTLNFTGTWSDGTSATGSLAWAPDGGPAARAAGARRAQNQK